MASSQDVPRGPVYDGAGGVVGRPRNGLGIAALLFWTVVGGILLGLAAAVLGVLGFRRARRGGATNAVMSVVGAVIGAVVLVVSGAILAFGVSLLNSHDFKNLQDCLKHAHTTAARHQCQKDFSHHVTGG